MIKLHAIHAGLFKLDGGAMFGVVPKSLWNKLNTADENNMCTWALRCLLIETDTKRILIDTGLGNKQDDKFFAHYYLHGNYSLLNSLKSKGFSPQDITDVVHTHLHFDHCGGSVQKVNENFELTFPNATQWVHQEQWNLAINPNDREKASFLKENILPMEQSGKLKFIDLHNPIIPELDFIVVNGHTQAMSLPVIKFNEQEVIYTADLFPSMHHIPIAWAMAYDMQPLVSLAEKKQVLQRALKNNSILYFEHDHVNEACTVHQTEKGIKVQQVMQLVNQQFEKIN